MDNWPTSAATGQAAKGDLDLYRFELPEATRATAVGYIHGKVTDRTTGKAVEADVELYDVTTGKLATAAYSDPQTGEFLGVPSTRPRVCA
jgi:hypothetical protein